MIPSESDLVALARIKSHGEDPASWGMAESADAIPEVGPEGRASLSGLVVSFGLSRFPPTGSAAEAGTLIVMRHATVARIDDPKVAPELGDVEAIATALGFGDAAPCVMAEGPDGAIVATVVEDSGQRVTQVPNNRHGRRKMARSGVAVTGDGKPEPARAEEGPSRNAPCSCGSGRKWKRCHGAPGGPTP